MDICLLELGLSSPVPHFPHSLVPLPEYDADPVET